MKRKIVLSVVAAMLFVPLRGYTAPNTPSVYISEVNWGGSELSNADEYLELTNPGEEAIDLTGWSIAGAATSGEVLMLPDGVTIEPNSTFLIANYGKDNSTLNRTADFVTSALAISNSGLGLVLLDGSNSEIDVCGTGGSPLAGISRGRLGGPASMVRLDPTVPGDSPEAWITATASVNFDDGVTQYGTPGEIETGYTLSEPNTPEEEMQPMEDVAEPTPQQESIKEDEAEEPPTANKVTEPASETNMEEKEEENKRTEETPIVEESEPGEDNPQTSTASPSVPPEQPGQASPNNSPLVEEVVMAEDAEKEPVEEAVTKETNKISATEEQKTEKENPEPDITEKPDPETTTFTYPPGTMIINEFVADPAEGNEWVEIFNPFNNTIPLEGWQVREAGGTTVNLGEHYLGFQQFVVVEFKSRLNNSGDLIELVDPAGQVIDSVSYGDRADSIAPAVKDPNSVARGLDEEWQETETPTKGYVNEITMTADDPSPSAKASKNKKEAVAKETKQPEDSLETPEALDTPKTLRLLELFPNPEDEEDEFIRIENFGSEPVPLKGFVVKDESRSFELAGELGAGLELTLPRSITKIALNNSSETVTLVSPEGDILDSVTYEKTIEGAYYAHTNEGWVWPGTSPENEPKNATQDDHANSVKAVSSNSTKSVTKSTKKKATKSATSSASIEGVVIVPPDVLSTQTMYIDGMQLFQYRGDFPELEIGDLVRVRGARSTVHGENRIKVSSASRISIVGKEEVRAEDYSLSELNGSVVGQLVRVSGIIVERNGDHFVMESNGEELDVIVKDGTKISLSEFDPGSEVTVTGVLSTYNTSLRLLPRQPADIEIKKENAPQASTATISQKGRLSDAALGLGLLTLTVLLVAGAGFNFIKRNKKKINQTGGLTATA